MVWLSCFQNEGRGTFAEPGDAFRQPRLLHKRLRQHYRRAAQESQMRSHTLVHLLDGRRESIRQPVAFDGGIEIGHSDHNFCYAAEIPGAGLLLRKGALLARCKIMDQERKERAIGFVSHLRRFPVQPHPVRPLAAAAHWRCHWNARRAEAFHFSRHIFLAHRPGARSGVSLHQLRPGMLVDHLRIGAGLDRNQLQIGSVGKTDQSHFGSPVAVGTSVRTGNSDG